MAARPGLLILVSALLAFVVLGCATSKDVVANPAAVGKQYRSAFLVAHGDRSSDVDAAIQRELFRAGATVSAGSEGRHPETADLIVKYVDDCGWDMAMYLRALDIQMYDARTGGMVASARWKNSPMHGFHGLEKMIRQLVGEMLKKLGMGPAV